MRAGVVVLPLEPVTATMGPRQNQPATSISPTTGTPASIAETTTGDVLGTPGLSTIRSAARALTSSVP